MGVSGKQGDYLFSHYFVMFLEVLKKKKRCAYIKMLYVKAMSSANIVKFKSHTTHNQFRKCHRNGIQKPRSQRYKTVKDGPQLPDKHALAEKHNKKGLQSRGLCLPV